MKDVISSVCNDKAVIGVIYADLKGGLLMPDAISPTPWAGFGDVSGRSQ